MNRAIKIIIVFLICASFGIFMLDRAANGVTIEYSQLPAPERKVANMLNEVYADIVPHKSYSLRRGNYYVFMRYAPGTAKRSGDKINLSGMVAGQRREKLTNAQLKAKERQGREELTECVQVGCVIVRTQ